MAQHWRDGGNRFDLSVMCCALRIPSHPFWSHIAGVAQGNNVVSNCFIFSLFPAERARATGCGGGDQGRRRRGKGKTTNSSLLVAAVYLCHFFVPTVEQSTF